MILLTILAIIIALLVILAIAILSIGGTVGFVIFGDLVVCIALIIWIMRKIWKRRH